MYVLVRALPDESRARTMLLMEIYMTAREKQRGRARLQNETSDTPASVARLLITITVTVKSSSGTL